MTLGPGETDPSQSLGGERAGQPHGAIFYLDDVAYSA